MKFIQLNVLVNGEERDTFAKGDHHQQVEEIVDLVIREMDDHDAVDAPPSAIEVTSRNLVDESTYETESNHSMTFDVSRHTEQPYGDCYYGSRYRPTKQTRSLGPVGYDELDE